MSIIVNTKLGEHRGKKRIWLEGQKLTRMGFEPGMKLQVSVNNETLVLRAASSGQFTVSKRERNGKTSPIIDLTANELAKLFDGFQVLRVVIRAGSIIISAHQQQLRIQEREERLRTKIEQRASLDICSIFHGGGILDKALHEGLQESGVHSKVSVAVELVDKYIESSLRNNPELWSQDSVVLQSAIEHVNLNRNPSQVDVVIGGIPCTGASRAGRAKNKLDFAEAHSSAGSMFFFFLQFIQTLNPSIIVIENVPEYAKTASMEVIRSVLGSLGYSLQERILDGNDFGALEKRKRLCVVAISDGLSNIFSLDTVQPIRKAEESLNVILEPIEMGSDRWRTFDYLAEKELRDQAAGKGFRRQLLTGDEACCGTIGRDYAKCRSTEPFLIHPEKAHLSRLFTPIEHARIKGIPEGVIDGLSDTVAHEILGQSVIYPAFKALALHLGQAIKKAFSLSNLHSSNQPELGKQIPSKGGSFLGLFANCDSQKSLFAV